MAHPNRLDSSRVTANVATKEEIKPLLDYLASLGLPVDSLHVEINVGNSIAAPDTLGELLALVTENNSLLKEIKMTDAELTTLLNKIDATTNKTADNVKMIADTDQKISDEIDKFLAAPPPGTVLSPEAQTQLQAIADRAQATSDASDAQLAVLQAIAAKGAPVVPPPPPPPVLPTP